MYSDVLNISGMLNFACRKWPEKSKSASNARDESAIYCPWCWHVHRPGTSWDLDLSQRASMRFYLLFFHLEVIYNNQVLDPAKFHSPPKNCIHLTSQTGFSPRPRGPLFPFARARSPGSWGVSWAFAPPATWRRAPRSMASSCDAPGRSYGRPVGWGKCLGGYTRSCQKFLEVG